MPRTQKSSSAAARKNKSSTRSKTRKATPRVAPAKTTKRGEAKQVANGGAKAQGSKKSAIPKYRAGQQQLQWRVRIESVNYVDPNSFPRMFIPDNPIEYKVTISFEHAPLNVQPALPPVPQDNRPDDIVVAALWDAIHRLANPVHDGASFNAYSDAFATDTDLLLCPVLTIYTRVEHDFPISVEPDHRNLQQQTAIRNFQQDMISLMANEENYNRFRNMQPALPPVQPGIPALNFDALLR